MSFIEKKLTAVLLELAAEEFANHGCNDFDLHEHMSPQEALDFQKRMHEWNGDPEEAPTDCGRWAQDHFVMSYLAAKLGSS